MRLPDGVAARDLGDRHVPPRAAGRGTALRVRLDDHHRSVHGGPGAVERGSQPADAVHVVAAVLRNRDGEVLLARRPEHAHQGGLWEFPGGKVEKGEAVEAALRRELAEELGVVCGSACPLITVSHRYSDKHVWLDVWELTDWTGTPAGREGQPLRWVHPDALHEVAKNVYDVRATDLIYWQTLLAIRDVPAAARVLAAEGLRLVSTGVVESAGAQRKSGKAVVLRDPDGHTLQLRAR